MLNLYTLGTGKSDLHKQYTKAEKYSLLYHNLFDYPLNLADTIKWSPSVKKVLSDKEVNISFQNGYFYIQENTGVIFKRLLRKRVSAKKMIIAKKVGRILTFLPQVRMVAVTGSLAMENSNEDSDIDLMIITKKDSLWTTRLCVYLLLVISGIRFRRSNETNQKDKLCLNMWLDESDLVWKSRDRNFYSAHEIAQIVPLVNKDYTYEKFINQNKWILKFWPNAVRIKVERKSKSRKVLNPSFLFPLFSLIEKFAYKLQYQRMKSKITRETISPTRALFHPQDWGKVVLKSLLV